MQRQFLLVRAVKSINDTLGTEGMDPSALAFGEFPGLRSLCGPVVPGPSPAEREEAAQQARHCMSQHVAKVKFKRAIHHNTPLATDRVCQRGNEVLLWHEKRVEIRIGQWIGSYSVVTTDSRVKIVFAQKEADSAQGCFNTTQVKTFLRPEKEAVAFINIFDRAFCTYATKALPFRIRIHHSKSTDVRAQIMKLRPSSAEPILHPLLPVLLELVERVRCKSLK